MGYSWCSRIWESELESIEGEYKVSNITHIYELCMIQLIDYSVQNFIKFRTDSSTLCFDKNARNYNVNFKGTTGNQRNPTLNFHKKSFSLQSISIHTPLQETTILPIHAIGRCLHIDSHLFVTVLSKWAETKYIYTERRHTISLHNKCYTFTYTHNHTLKISMGKIGKFLLLQRMRYHVLTKKSTE